MYRFHLREIGLIYIMNTRCLYVHIGNIRRLIRDNIDTKYSRHLHVVRFFLVGCFVCSVRIWILPYVECYNEHQHPLRCIQIYIHTDSEYILDETNGEYKRSRHFVHKQLVEVNIFHMKKPFWKCSYNT